VVCESCGASLVEGTSGSFGRQGGGPKPAEEEEELFSLAEDLKRRRREIVRGITSGIGAGLLLTGLIVGGLYYWTRWCQPLPPPVPPPAPSPGQLAARGMTAEELGLSITGAGAQDPGRSPETVREQVEAHFAELSEPAKPSDPRTPGEEPGFPRRYRVIQSTYVRDKPSWLSREVTKLEEGIKITVESGKSAGIRVEGPRERAVKAGGRPSIRLYCRRIAPRRG
jgi:hypothetical protein